ncbi:MAG: oxidative damage protection protein [Gammaproteobacteria bacterium]|nr:oxidative damage protection protein [Gammaproteobacteria bacterium]MYD79750.1 oxidative damage protection protein [Gammaproteobacteria bacterium]
MTRMVLCRKYGEQLPGLKAPPMPGPLGQDLFENVSVKAWEDWQELQTMLINEHHLSMQDFEARRYLMAQMKKFFDNEEVDRPSGYVAPPVADKGNNKAD